MGASAAIIGGAQAVTSIGGAYSQAKAQQEQGAYQSTVSEINSQVAGIQGEEAIAAGGRQANYISDQGVQVAGEQRAAAAAQGIDVNTGSAAALQADTENQARIAGMQVKNNAWLQSWGYKTTALNDSYAGQFASISATNAASSTLLTGGLNAISAIGNTFRPYSGYGNRGGGYDGYGTEYSGP